MNIRKLKRVFVAMSGGVDSSVAAFLLVKNKNYEVIGCFIKGYNIDGCQEADAEDARRTAEFLKIPFYVIDLEKEYKKMVVDYMINGYKKGITPNPDVMCNKEIKFGLFLEKALEMGVDYVATGHYVKLATSNKRQGERKEKSLSHVTGRLSLFTAKDKNKDQSYFLWTLTQEQLKHCLFPIGDYLKSEVRGIAKKAGLPTAEKKDSQGICFLGMVKFKDFLKQYLSVKKGDVLSVDGKKIGEHNGVWFYTIGQRHIGSNFQFPRLRRGFGGQAISNFQKNRKPLYVVEKNIKKNILIVAEGENNPALYKNEIKLTDVNFISSLLPSLIRANSGIDVLARVRYRQQLFSATLYKLKTNSYKLIFAEPVKFVAPGQSTVFYLPTEASAKEGDKNGEMFGGGVIV